MREGQINEVGRKDGDRVDTAVLRSFSKSETYLALFKPRTWAVMRIVQFSISGRCIGFVTLALLGVGR